MILTIADRSHFGPLRLLAAALLLLFSACGSDAAAPAPPVSQQDGLAIRGYDPVAFFNEGRPVRGRPDIVAEHEGASWRFASEANRARFLADPAAHAPQFGGYCAWAVSQGYLAPGDPNHWKIVDGRLYLNANARAKMLWEADQADAIVRGHANWPGVLGDNQETGRS